MSMRRSRFLQYRLMTLFSGSKDRRISKRILLIFSDTIDSSRESILDYRACGGFEREISGFVDIIFGDTIFIDVVFGREPLGSRTENRGSSPDKECVRGALGAGCSSGSPGSCE